jgi:CheY-like chemotaxis protein
MPRMNGYQASTRIRQKEKENKYPRTFICAVSGNRDCSSKCFESEMNYIGMGYLALKPISVSMLEAVIRHRRDIEL